MQQAGTADQKNRVLCAYRMWGDWRQAVRWLQAGEPFIEID
jgi:hypothetical protein